MRYIIAFDCGTTAIKAVCIDRETGQLTQGKADCRLFIPQTNYAEQDAAELWDDLCRACRECVEKAAIDPHQVGGVVFCAPWRHIIPLNDNCEPMRPSMIWMDARGIDQARRLNELSGTSFYTGQDYHARLLWLKENEPELWHSARHIVGINCYFKYRATGQLVTECSDDFIHTPNPNVQAQYTQTLRLMGLTEEDLQKFPPSLPSTAVVGTLHEEGARQLGLVAGIPVVGGFGDLNAITFGCGAHHKGLTHIYLGTSGWLCETGHERIDGYGSNCFTLDEKHENSIFSLQTSGRAYDWLLEQFYSAEKEQLGEGVFGFVEKEVAAVAPGCDGLIATHWLTGELPPLAAKNAKALFFNITDLHRRAHFARAMMESICYTHRFSMEQYRQRHGALPKDIRVVGGGAQSATWMQMMADILGVPVRVPANPRYVGTMGSYYCALVGLGLAKDYDDAIASQALGEETVYLPNEDNRAVYDRNFSVYSKLYTTLQPLYDELNGKY